MMATLRRWYGSTLGHAALSAALLCAAFPPLGRIKLPGLELHIHLWPLAWIAPLWWILLVRRDRLPCPWPWSDPAGGGETASGLPAIRRGRRAYAPLWVAGFGFWMVVLHWLRLPYWATCFGWVALSGYLAFYLPLFVALTRVAVHRLRIPVIVAAPAIWTGLELARAHVLTGFTMGELGHSQYRWITLIQVSDLCGGYGVDFLVMFVAACLGRMAPLGAEKGAARWAFWPLAPAAVLVGLALCYGAMRTSGHHTSPGARVALIQGSIDTELKSDEGRWREILRHYDDLSLRAVKEHADVDLLIWPETMFRLPLYVVDDDARLPEDPQRSPAEVRADLLKFADGARRQMQNTAQWLGVPMILGVDCVHFTADRPHCFNSAVFLSRDGKFAEARYDKNNLVVFGEYTPFARSVPLLASLSPIGEGVDAGDGPAVFTLKKLRMAPNICYETVLPHAIRSQVQTLTARGQEPDVLVNLTNDGWFWGSSELDLHLICGVFRAVECRKPLLIAANTGISAWIDADGRIRAQGPHRQTDVVIADVEVDARKSWYVVHGDLPAGICLGLCVVAIIAGMVPRRSGTP